MLYLCFNIYFHSCLDHLLLVCFVAVLVLTLFLSHFTVNKPACTSVYTELSPGLVIGHCCILVQSCKCVEIRACSTCRCHMWRFLFVCAADVSNIVKWQSANNVSKGQQRVLTLLQTSTTSTVQNSKRCYFVEMSERGGKLLWCVSVVFADHIKKAQLGRSQESQPGLLK